MNRELPPIAKLAMRILAVIEDAVSRFPRRHRYTLGADLRGQAMQVARCAHLAWRDHGGRQRRVQDLCTAVDDLKLTLQLGQAVSAFRSFREFEAISRLANDLGRQCGGWLKQLCAKGQNAAGNLPTQRVPILSSRATPRGVTP